MHSTLLACYCRKSQRPSNFSQQCRARDLGSILGDSIRGVLVDDRGVEHEVDALQEERVVYRHGARAAHILSLEL